MFECFYKMKFLQKISKYDNTIKKELKNQYEQNGASTKFFLKYVNLNFSIFVVK